MSAITGKFAMTVETSTANSTPLHTSIRNRKDFRVILPRQPQESYKVAQGSLATKASTMTNLRRPQYSRSHDAMCDRSAEGGLSYESCYEGNFKSNMTGNVCIP
jgi:hypothetical protein